MKTVRIGVFKTSDSLEHALRNALNAAEWNRHIQGKVFIKPNLCADIFGLQVIYILIGVLSLVAAFTAYFTFKK